MSSGLINRLKWQNRILVNGRPEHNDYAVQPGDVITALLDDPQPDTLDLLDTIKLNLYAQEILVFTPKGEIKTMPAGSTVLDFAFSIHSFLGSHCFGAKVNHKLEPLSYQLKSGDQIEILTSKTQHVQPEWLNFATSAKARGKIQAILRRERREKEVQGEAMLKEFLERYDVAYNTNVVEKLCKQNAVKTRDELFLAIADKKKVLTEADIDQLTGKNSNNGWRKLLTFLNKSKEDVQTVTDGSIAALETREFVKGLNKKKVLALDEEVLLHCTFPTCCTVVPGDDVLGYINENGGLEIHRRQCETATKYKTRHGNNIIACSWNTGRVRYFDTRIFVRGVDAKGVLHSIADCFETLQHYLVKEITLKTNDGIFEGSLLVSVYHVDDISMICDALRKIENVTKAVRMD